MRYPFIAIQKIKPKDAGSILEWVSRDDGGVLLSGGAGPQ